MNSTNCGNAGELPNNALKLFRLWADVVDKSDGSNVLVTAFNEEGSANGGVADFVEESENFWDGFFF